MGVCEGGGERRKERARATRVRVTEEDKDTSRRTSRRPQHSTNLQRTPHLALFEQRGELVQKLSEVRVDPVLLLLRRPRHGLVHPPHPLDPSLQYAACLAPMRSVSRCQILRRTLAIFLPDSA